MNFTFQTGQHADVTNRGEHAIAPRRHRRTYGALSIAARHPRLFQRLASQYRPPSDRSLA